MTVEEKLTTLAYAAKFDASCASSGSERGSTPGSLGNTTRIGICHSWSEDGRCVSLLKLLLTNECVYDCAYCVNRASSKVKRARFTAEEIADLTIKFYVRNYIEGLFLSSAIYKNSDYTMQQIITVIKLLRTKHKFNGYIHVKAMPGADEHLLREAGSYADRISANIELPTRKSLHYLAPQKSGTTIFQSMNQINNQISYFADKKEKSSYKRSFLPAGQSTQLIVGATADSDRTILNLSEALYSKFSLRRVYYSAYIASVSDDKRLPQSTPPLKRENLLYQADWLLRFYGFKAEELLSAEKSNFDYSLDPKTFWALCNFQLFPVEINSVDFEMLIRVPGIGLRSAHKIVAARRVQHLIFDDLTKIGVVMKRARFFITCRGKHQNRHIDDPNVIRMHLDRRLNKLPQKARKEIDHGQQFLFSKTLFPSLENRSNALTGEI